MIDLSTTGPGSTSFPTTFLTVLLGESADMSWSFIGQTEDRQGNSWLTDNDDDDDDDDDGNGSNVIPKAVAVTAAGSAYKFRTLSNFTSTTSER